jgi:outer membrane protein assembly factor BamB
VGNQRCEGAASRYRKVAARAARSLAEPRARSQRKRRLRRFTDAFTTADGTELVAAPNKDGVLYVLQRNALSAGPIWTYQLAVGGNPVAGEGSLVAPTFTHGMLIGAGGETPQGEPGSVVAFDPGTGALKWRHVTPGFVLAAMPAVGDILIVVSNASDFSWSKLELLDLNDGTVVKAFDAQGATLGAPSVGRGLILWYHYSGELHALRIPDLP